MMPSLVRDPSQFPEWVRLAKDGNNDALGELLDYVGPTLRSQARRRLDHRLQSKFTESDLAQETKLRALVGIHDFRGITEKEFIGWLLVILENVAKEFKRHYHAAKRDADREVRLTLDGEELAWFPDVFAPDGPGPAMITTAEMRKCLAAIMDQLPETNRRVLRMIHWEGREFLQVAERLRLLPNEVRAIYEQAVELVRKQLGR